jgi:eukaryotic-like serine/threonine-protein kinase
VSALCGDNVAWRLDLVMAAEDLEVGRTEVGGSDPAPASGTPAWRAGAQVGRYTLEAPIGAGGMGQVFKAWDPTLHRHVALKLLRSPDPEMGARFVREAQAQARVEHPNVCQVYEVGEVDGWPFIAMQLIEGETLARLAGELTLEEKLQIVRTVSEAVHAAHRLGLVHRDLKPGNVMVERSPDGALVPYVLDFGLAHDLGGSGHTRTGVVMGTAGYMAPEQARGEIGRIDRRTDVFSLGAVLYELTAGERPFGGGSDLDVLLRVAEQDAVPLRRVAPHAPQDLETIVMKCLEREPPRRYDSARALAADLEAFLAGEAIKARSPTLRYRLAKRVRKHRAAVVVGGVAFLLILVLVGVGLGGRWRAGERARLAQRFGQEVANVEGLLRYASALPLHDTRNERAEVLARMASLESEMRELGSVAEGPGQYALGRGAYALGDLQGARRHLQVAWDSGYRLAEVATTMGLVLAELYQDGIRDAQRTANKELREARRKQLSAELRAPAREFLREGAGATRLPAVYVQGIDDLLDGRWEEGLQHADAAMRIAPWLYEAVALRGKLLTTRAVGKVERGDLAGAQADVLEAGDAYRRAADMARSDPRVLTDEASRRVLVLIMALQRGLPASAELDAAVKACDEAALADPDRPTPYQTRAEAYLRYADAVLRRGQDAGAALDSAVASAREALRRDSGNANALHLIGATLMTRAMLVELRAGRDPRPLLAEAASYFEKAVAVNPGMAPAVFNGAVVWAVQAEYELARGLDPRPSLDRAITALEKAVAGNPDLVMLLNNLGSVYLRKAEWEAAHGLDPRVSYGKSAEAAARAGRLNPSLALLPNLAGAAHEGVARYELAHGLDPRPEVEKATAAYRQALALDPKYALALSNIGEASLVAAEWQRLTGGDPGPTLATAIESVKAALAANPKMRDEGPNNLAAAHVFRARLAVDRGLDPGADLAGAREACTAALGVNPASWRAFMWRGRAETLAARSAIQAGRSPDRALRAAVESLERARQANPTAVELALAAAELAEVQVASRPGRGSQAELQAALTLLRRGLEVNADDAALLAASGRLLLLAAETSHDLSGREKLRQQGAGALQRALAINPLLRRDLGPWLERGQPR